MAPDTSNHVFFGLTFCFDLTYIVFWGFGFLLLQIKSKEGTSNVNKMPMCGLPHNNK